MSRRVLRKETPESLKEAKAKEQAALANANRANSDAATAAFEVTQINKLTEKAKLVLETEEAKIPAIKARVEAANAVAVKADKELRGVEGQLADKQKELAKIEEGISNAVRKQEEGFKEHQDAHRKTIASLQEQSASARSETVKLASLKTEAKDSLAKAKKELMGLQEDEKKLRAIVAELPQKQTELEDLESAILKKQVELQQVEKQCQETKSDRNDEVNKLAEAKSLVLVEENKATEIRQKHIEKENEIATKMENLRVLKDGVDQATVRLKRRESDLEMKKHLDGKEVITN